MVDTLQKVREVVNDSYSYSSDYEVIGKLKQFADRYGVCVLIVHPPESSLRETALR